MAQKFTNAARSPLMANIVAGDTSITVDASLADLFPIADTDANPVGTPGKGWFKVVLEDVSHNLEIVYVRTRASGVATLSNCQRGQEGTTARSYLAGSIVGLRFTALDYENAVAGPAADIYAATSKATPADDDELGIVDSAAANVLKKLTWANLKATLKTYFDTLYSTAAAIYAGKGANIDITSLGNNTSTIYTTAGTSIAYTITPVPAYTAYAIGMSAMVNFNAASGASPTIAWNGIASPPQLVKENADGTFSNIAANDIPINHRSRVTLISTTQALVERLAASLNGAQTGTAPLYAARAWVNFNGTGTVAIRASGNVSSITDNGVGDYTVNLTTAMPDANFAPLTGGSVDAAGSTTDSPRQGPSASVIDASTIRVHTGFDSGAYTDWAQVFIGIFR